MNIRSPGQGCAAAYSTPETDIVLNAKSAEILDAAGCCRTAATRLLGIPVEAVPPKIVTEGTGSRSTKGGHNGYILTFGDT